MSDLRPDIESIVDSLKELNCPIHNERPDLILSDNKLSIQNPCCEEIQLLVQQELKAKLQDNMKGKLTDHLREQLKNAFKN